jgi:hypothetical protein
LVRESSSVSTVEIRIPPAELTARMDELRRWLAACRGAHKLTSTGSSNETVVLVDFQFAADAADFAREFGGSLVAG